MLRSLKIMCGDNIIITEEYFDVEIIEIDVKHGNGNKIIIKKNVLMFRSMKMMLRMKIMKKMRVDGEYRP